MFSQQIHRVFEFPVFPLVLLFRETIKQIPALSMTPATHPYLERLDFEQSILDLLELGSIQNGSLGGQQLAQGANFGAIRFCKGSQIIKGWARAVESLGVFNPAPRSEGHNRIVIGKVTHIV